VRGGARPTTGSLGRQAGARERPAAEFASLAGMLR
jgi:hypothetical protein